VLLAVVACLDLKISITHKAPNPQTILSLNTVKMMLPDYMNCEDVATSFGLIVLHYFSNSHFHTYPSKQICWFSVPNVCVEEGLLLG
jgi:hypothetical protein